ncbi:MAG: rhamnulokinase, partial [Anaerolineae bacterium]|nr:rhamnulokinase [Anaerolineae bacterium]
WNTFSLFSEMKQGLAKAITEERLEIATLGIDTWGVDFGLLDRAGNLIGNPYHYRDPRTEGIFEKAFAVVPRAEIFAGTGIQFMPLNTIFQLFAMARQKDPAFDIAETLLLMPDLLTYWFTGHKVSEYTIASTSQCLNMASGEWATALVERLGIPGHIFPEVVPPGTKLGPLLPALTEELNLWTDLTVIAPGGHDTACAVAGVPAAAGEKGFAYISSGTWSLVGMEIAQPIINETALNYNFTNEGGVDNTIRLLRNIAGMWLVQESRRIWAQQGEALSYDELTSLAATAPPFAALINPDDPGFGPPGDLPGRIQAFCRERGQAVPESKGAIVRCVLESLALRYRWVIEKAAEVSGQPITVLHIVGGGSQNRLLNQFAADATGLPVVAGPVEATALGNVLMQMLAVGEISSLSEGRDLIGRSFPVETYEPQETAAWDEAYQKFLRIIE